MHPDVPGRDDGEEGLEDLHLDPLVRQRPGEAVGHGRRQVVVKQGGTFPTAAPRGSAGAVVGLGVSPAGGQGVGVQLDRCRRRRRVGFLCVLRRGKVLLADVTVSHQFFCREKQ